MEEKLYTIRSLTADDMFPVFRILSKIGIKEFKSCFNTDDVRRMAKQAGEDDASVEAVGLTFFFELAGIVFENADKCRDDLYKFLSSLTGMSVKDIAMLPMAVFAQLIMDVVRKDDFKDFFRAVTGFMN